MSVLPQPGRVAAALRARAGAAAREIERRRFERRLALPRLLRAFADVHPEAVFVEIGSNDGEQHDHLRPFILSRRWSGVMVEPVPYVFERLQRNYAGIDRVRLENAAIATQDGHLPFFHLVDATPEERAQLPDWYDGIGRSRATRCSRTASTCPTSAGGWSAGRSAR
jgi:FkbM family methyltransferase